MLLLENIKSIDNLDSHLVIDDKQPEAFHFSRSLGGYLFIFSLHFIINACELFLKWMKNGGKEKILTFSNNMKILN